MAIAAAGVLAGVPMWLLKRHGEGALDLSVGPWILRVGTPRSLLVLAVVPLLVATTLGSLADASRRLRVVQLAARIVLLSLLALALTDLALKDDRREVSLVALVDVSGSVPDAKLTETSRMIERLASAVSRRDPPASLRVVRFAANAEEIRGAPTRFAAPVGDDTDLGAALALSLGLLDPGKVPRVVLLSDGRPTRGDVLVQAERAAARNVRIFSVPLQGSKDDDVALLSVSAPQIVRPRAAFDLEIRIMATRAGHLRLALTRDGTPHTPDGERAFDVAAGITTLRWTTRLERDAPAVYRVAIRDADANGHRENDVGVLAIAPQGRPRVLFIERGGGNGSPLPRALDAESIEVDTRGPEALPDRPGLDRFDLIILSDVPRAALRDSAMQALTGFVRDGGGLLVGGGPDSLGSGAYAGTRLENLLPIRQDMSGEREEATLALALVIDRSGSMSGPKMELTKEAARGTAEMLDAQDLISVIVFDSQAQTVVRLQPAGNRQRILGDIAQIRASGGTNILPGLREAFEQLVPARAKKKHVIVLSDGQSPAEGISELVDEAAGGHITVSAVGVGEGADLTLLQMIAARGGGRFYHTRDPASIPRIFTRETQQISRSAVVEEPTFAKAVKRADMLGGVALEAAPALHGYTRIRARKEAELVLATGQGDPLLVRWQQGLGQVTVWTSDLGNRWAISWARWPSFAKLWAQIARATMRRRAASHFPVETVVDGEHVLARLRASGADDRALTGLDGDLVVTRVAPDGGSINATGPLRIPLTERAAGVYEAEFSLAGAPAALLDAKLFSRPNHLAAAAGAGRVAVPLSRELMPVPPPSASPDSAAVSLGGHRLLQVLAERTGGRLVDDPEAALDAGTDVIPALRSLGTPVVLLALLLFFVDLALRRVRFRGLPKTSGRGAAW